MSEPADTSALRWEYRGLRLLSIVARGEGVVDRLRAVGVESFNAGDEELAAQSFRRAGTVAKYESLGDVWLGQMYYEDDRFDEAREAFQQAVDADFTDPDALRGLAMSLQMLGDSDGASYHYLMALAYLPGDFESRINLGIVYYNQGRVADAIEQLEQARSAEPDYYYTHYLLGRVLHDAAEFESAEAALQRAIELNPDHEDSHLRLGELQEARGQTQEAVASYRRAVELSPDDPYVQSALADALTEVQDPDGALEHARIALRGFKAIDLREEIARVHWTIGWALYQKRQWKESAAASRAALRLDPTLMPVRFNVAIALLRDGRTKEARRMYELILEDIDDALDLEVHGIGDLEEALKEEPDLEGAEQILKQLKDKDRELLKQVEQARELRSARP
jgi:tetratricopeptide (TPR) repeat protein